MSEWVKESTHLVFFTLLCLDETEKKIQEANSGLKERLQSVKTRLESSEKRFKEMQTMTGRRLQALEQNIKSLSLDKISLENPLSENGEEATPLKEKIVEMEKIIEVLSLNSLNINQGVQKIQKEWDELSENYSRTLNDEQNEEAVTVARLENLEVLVSNVSNQISKLQEDSVEKNTILKRNIDRMLSPLVNEGIQVSSLKEII